jgi:hypothetical protein
MSCSHLAMLQQPTAATARNRSSKRQKRSSGWRRSQADVPDSKGLIVIRYAWAFPNTLIGLFILAASIRRARVQLVDGVIEAHGPAIAWLLRHAIPIAGGAAAITFGHVVLGCDAWSLMVTRAHERVHVRQCEVWGPAFIPAYLSAGLVALLSGSGAYHGNYFERQARQWDADSE